MANRLNVGQDSVYFISEIGLNHNGDPRLARNLIDISINAGCAAVKFQKRNVANMFTKAVLDQSFDRFPALGSTQREVRESLELSKEAYRELREYCRGKIDFMVTTFDIPSVEFFDDLDLDSYKIASHIATDVPLLREVAKRGKPVVASTGMANAMEIERMVEIFKDVDLTLLHCISCYPTKTTDANLGMIQWLNRFGVRVGYSDHEDGITVAPVAVALGAEVIEKHVTLDKNLPGFDHFMSIEPWQIVEVVRNLNEVRRALTQPNVKELNPCELMMFDNRRGSLHATCAIPQGTCIDESMVTVKAPLRGLTPRFIDQVVGGRALYDLNADDPITFGVVELAN